MCISQVGQTLTAGQGCSSNSILERLAYTWIVASSFRRISLLLAQLTNVAGMQT